MWKLIQRTRAKVDYEIDCIMRFADNFTNQLDINQTLRTWLETQFTQCYGHEKDRNCQIY